VISVIIPVFNHAAFVSDAVASARQQTLPPAEIVVVDDGSTDGSGARAAAAGARVVTVPHAGLSAALNRGVAATSEPFVAFLDADDLWPPDKLARQMAAIGDREAAFGWVEEFSAEAARLRRLPGLIKGAMLIRREALARVGPFDETLTIGDFVDWFARAQELGLTYVMLEDVVLRRRVHAANLARNRAGEYADYLRILKASLDRRRT
jgi:glycosyltransferase involved in cell wall biosynthesis